MILHGLFDILALIAALVAFRLVPIGVRAPWRVQPQYWVAASFGATLSAYGFGSLNLWISGIDGLARSVEGGLAGGVIGIELLKARVGIRGSTGVRLAVPLAAAIAVGRIGCFLAGLDDHTYGTATSLPWGVDFGDGVRRHPVQLYESAVMVAFIVTFLVLRRRQQPIAIAAGFYLFVGVYAAQRFVWEFCCVTRAPISSSGRPHRSARPAWSWCRRRSFRKTTRSIIGNAAPSTVCSVRSLRAMPRIGSCAGTISSPVTYRCAFIRASRRDVPMIADSVPITSSTAAWL